MLQNSMITITGIVFFLVHTQKKSNRNIYIPEIIFAGLCYTMPLIIPSGLQSTDPHAPVLNLWDKSYLTDQECVMFHPYVLGSTLHVLDGQEFYNSYVCGINLVDCAPSNYQQMDKALHTVCSIFSTFDIGKPCVLCDILLCVPATLFVFPFLCQG